MTNENDLFKRVVSMRFEMNESRQRPAHTLSRVNLNGKMF